jgi:hypothetical protein
VSINTQSSMRNNTLSPTPELCSCKRTAYVPDSSWQTQTNHSFTRVLSCVVQMSNIHAIPGNVVWMPIEHPQVATHVCPRVRFITRVVGNKDYRWPVLLRFPAWE